MEIMTLVQAHDFPRTINSRLPSHSERLLPYHVRLLSEANIGSPRRAGLLRPNRHLKLRELRRSRSKADIQLRHDIGRYGPSDSCTAANRVLTRSPRRRATRSLQGSSGRFPWQFSDLK
jgi:hypothetical protein